MIEICELSEDEYFDYLILLDSLSVPDVIIPRNVEYVEDILKKADKILNVVLFNFGHKKVHELQRFYYTHVYIVLPEKKWITGDGSSSHRRYNHNLMIDILVLKYPKLQEKVETIVLLKNRGYKIKGYAFFWEAIGLNYSLDVEKIYSMKDKLSYFTLGDNFELILNVGSKRIKL